MIDSYERWWLVECEKNKELRAALETAIRSHENLVELNILPPQYRDEARQIAASLRATLAETSPSDGRRRYTSLRDA